MLFGRNEEATADDNGAAADEDPAVKELKRRLQHYPDQRLVSFLVEGVRFEADVELQTVLVPHLMSLANGFDSVVKELKRMASPELDWYSMHASFPFWPMYSLGEGAQPRKLEAQAHCSLVSSSAADCCLEVAHDLRGAVEGVSGHRQCPLRAMHRPASEALKRSRMSRVLMLCIDDVTWQTPPLLQVAV